MNPCQRQGASPRFFGRLQTTATSATASPAASAVPLTDAASPGRERNGASHRFREIVVTRRRKGTSSAEKRA